MGKNNEMRRGPRTKPQDRRHSEGEEEEEEPAMEKRGARQIKRGVYETQQPKKKVFRGRGGQQRQKMLRNDKTGWSCRGPQPSCLQGPTQTSKCTP